MENSGHCVTLLQLTACTVTLGPKTDKGKLFNYSNKNTVVLKTQVHNNLRFPIVQRDYVEHRLNEKRNRDRIKKKMFNIPAPAAPNVR